MGLVKDFLFGGVNFFKEEIMPIRGELLKAGLLDPTKHFDTKASLTDPWATGSIGYGYKEKYSVLDYSKCRQITYADPVVAAIMQTRCNQVGAYCHVEHDKYRVGFRIKLKDSDKVPSEKEKKRMEEIEQFLLNTGAGEVNENPEYRRRDDFETFVRKIVRDSLTFDQVNFEITPRNDGTPYSFQAVDASTIRIIPDKKESVEGAMKWDKDFLKDHFMRDRGGEFNYHKAKIPRYAQVMYGMVCHTFDDDELAFGVRNPRTDVTSFGYGFSEIEQCVLTITSHMNAETYNRKFFSQGSTSKGILVFNGSVPPDQLEMFRKQWYQQGVGVNNAWRMPIISLGKDGQMQYQSLQNTNKEMEFGRWLDYCVKTLCAVFQMDPIEIGFDISKQGSGEKGTSGGLGDSKQQERIAFSQDKGLRPLLLFIQKLVNNYIISRIDEDVEFEFVGFGQSEDADLDKAIKQLKNYKTINEIREEQDLDPLPDFDKIKNPGDVVLDSSLLQFITQQMQQAQGLDEQGQPMEAGGEGGPGGGGEGGEGGEPPEPDYQNMSDEELQAEYDRLLAQEKGGGAAPKAKPAPKPAPKPGG